MDHLSIKKYDVVNDTLIIKWSDDIESYITLQRMRKVCPCAGCAGEEDALGNIYKGPEQQLNQSSYQLLNIKQIGYYALQPFWGDGHNTGIYRFELLKKLGDE